MFSHSLEERGREEKEKKPQMNADERR